MRGPACALAVALALLAGCGSSDEHGLTAHQHALLQAPIQRAREAAAGQDRAAAEQALEQLARRVRRLQAHGVLSDAEAQRILTGVRRAEARVPVDVAEPEPETQTAPVQPQPTTPAPPPEPHDHGKKPKGPAHGRGPHGHGPPGQEKQEKHGKHGKGEEHDD